MVMMHEVYVGSGAASSGAGPPLSHPRARVSVSEHSASRWRNGRERYFTAELLGAGRPARRVAPRAPPCPQPPKSGPNHPWRKQIRDEVEPLPGGSGASPAPAEAESRPLVGAMRGSVLRYDGPFEPAADPADWTVLR